MEAGAALLIAQSPGGIGGLSNQMSKAADESGVQPIIIVAGIVILVVVAVILFKLKRD
jgi:hypothetical protein